MTIWTSSAPSWAVFDPSIERDEKQSPPPANLTRSAYTPRRSLAETFMAQDAR
jgi:hypothetical protein